MLRVVRRVLAGGIVAVVGAALLAPAASAGVSGPAFYVDGELYRTVGTPTDFSHTGAPDHSFNTIYAFPAGTQRNVAEAAPGDRDFRGGRWMVHGLSFADYAAAVTAHDANGSGNFDSAEEVAAAIAAGSATDTGIVRMFECPVIKLPANQR
jgi:hypothetical protein